MKIIIGSDHGAFHEKQKIIEYFKDKHEFIDVGAYTEERSNYSDFAIKAVEQMRLDSNAMAILLCGSGIGISMAANRFKGIRAALCRTEEEAKLSRAHNNANALCLGGRITPIDDMFKMINVWLATPFEGGRHIERISLFENLGE